MDRCKSPRSPASRLARVPFPAPGGPKKTRRIGLLAALPGSAATHEALVVAHHEVAVELIHEVQRDRHHDEDRRAAERPQIDGQAVMDHLSTPPGRHIGDILKMLLEVKRVEGDLDDDEILRRVDRWWGENSSRYS